MLFTIAALCVALLVVVPVFGSFAPEIKIATAAAFVYPIMALGAIPVADDLRRLADAPTRPIWYSAYLQTGTTIFLSVSVAFAVGVVTAGVLSRSTGWLSVGSAPGGERRPGMLALTPSTLQGLLWMASLLLVLQVVTYGVGDLFNRPEYISSDPSAVNAAVGQMGPLGAAAAAVVATALTGPRRSGQLVFALYAVFAFGSATRALGLLAVLWLGAMFINGRRLTGPVIARQVVLMVLGTALALSSRGLEHHGLISYTEALIGDPLGSVGTGLELFVGAALLGPPLAGLVVARQSVSVHDIATSLSPLPGTMTDWPTISYALRVYSFVPYNGVGELWSVSSMLACAFFVVLGAVTTLCLRALWRVSGRAAPVLRCVGLVLAFFPLILLSEYNLRSGARFVWLEVALVVGVFYLRRRARRPEAVPA